MYGCNIILAESSVVVGEKSCMPGDGESTNDIYRQEPRQIDHTRLDSEGK